MIVRSALIASFLLASITAAAGDPVAIDVENATPYVIGALRVSPADREDWTSELLLAHAAPERRLDPGERGSVAV